MPCRAFTNDVRVRVVNTNSYYYPDLLVTCARTPEAMYLTAVTVEDPVLVICGDRIAADELSAGDQ